MVAGGRYELYSKCPLQIQAVAASVTSRPRMDGGGLGIPDRVSLCRAIDRAPGAFRNERACERRRLFRAVEPQEHRKSMFRMTNI
jgi:hypothetical protein